MKRKRIKFIFLLIWTFTLATFLWTSCGNRAPQCPLCERDVHSHMAVRITHNGIPLKTCCMTCALTYKMQEKSVKIQSATDYLTDQPLDPEKAIFLVASDVSPCTQDRKVQKVVREQHETMYACYDRCEPGILAFSKKKDAEEFQKQHGGHLVEQFEQLKTWLPGGGHKHDRPNH